MSITRFALMICFGAMLPTICLAQEGCTTRKLEGQYVFVGRGFIEAATPAFNAIITASSSLMVQEIYGQAVLSCGGKIGREKLEGAYTLDADCSGTMTFGSYVNPGAQIHWDIYVKRDGTKGHMIRMDEGNMAVRSFEK